MGADVSCSQSGGKRSLQYESPVAGQKQLSERYGYWTAKIGDLSFQASLALIAANWAVFSGDLENHSFAVASVLIALLSVVASLAGAAYLAALHFKAFDLSQKRKADWLRQWEESDHHTSTWPFNASIIRGGVCLTLVRLGLPILAGFFLLLAVVSKSAMPVETLGGHWDFFSKSSAGGSSRSSLWFTRRLTPTCLPGAWYRASSIGLPIDLVGNSAYRFISGNLEVLSYSPNCESYVLYQGRLGEFDFKGTYVRYEAGGFEEGSVRGLKRRSVAAKRTEGVDKELFWISAKDR